eukprot:2270646-Prymnesium_polylepis.2
MEQLPPEVLRVLSLPAQRLSACGREREQARRVSLLGDTRENVGRKLDELHFLARREHRAIVVAALRARSASVCEFTPPSRSPS